MTDSKLPLADKLTDVAKDLKSTDTGVRLIYGGDARTIREAAALLRQQHEALKRADMFITNGIEVGAIRMPDADCPDPAHETPGLIKAAIAAAEGEQS